MDRYRSTAWDDGAVVYDTLSGDTHFLDLMLYAVLDQVWQGAERSDIVLGGGSSSENHDEASCDPRIEYALDQLRRARLI